MSNSDKEGGGYEEEKVTEQYVAAAIIFTAKKLNTNAQCLPFLW